MPLPSRLFALLAALWTGLTVAAVAVAVPKDAKPSKEEIQKAERLIEDDLAALSGKRGKIEHLSADPLLQMFPRQILFSVVFRQYPVAQLAPPPLKAANIYAVARQGGELQRLTDAKELDKFLRDTLPAVKNAGDAKEAVRAWLELAPVLLQDGYFTFMVLDEATKARTQGGSIEASGKVLVKKGGSGELLVTLTFDQSGKLTRVQQTNKVKPGVRPICQATKLLDADRLIRAMAEQDLLVMGRAVKPYLDEQRAKARPELKKAIDHIWQRITEEDR
jgi:hypothetical protein